MIHRLDKGAYCLLAISAFHLFLLKFFNRRKTFIKEKAIVGASSKYYGSIIAALKSSLVTGLTMSGLKWPSVAWQLSPVSPNTCTWKPCLPGVRPATSPCNTVTWPALHQSQRTLGHVTSSPPITAHLQHHAVAGAVDQHAPRHADAVQHGARHEVHHCGSTRVTCHVSAASSWGDVGHLLFSCARCRICRGRGRGRSRRRRRPGPAAAAAWVVVVVGGDDRWQVTGAGLLTSCLQVQVQVQGLVQGLVLAGVVLCTNSP